MPIIFKSLTRIVLLTALLASCGTTEEARYRDTAVLEKPPTLVAGRPAEEQNEADNSEEPEAEAKTGLGTKVYITDSNPPLLIIKQPFNEAWNTLAQALKQQKLEITDRNREEGAYYVTYDPDSYESGGIFSFLNNDYAEEGYLLKLEAKDAETKVSAEAVDESAPPDDGQPADGADKLLMSLHKTLRDDLTEE